MTKKKICLILTGGTIAMEKGADNVLHPSTKDILTRVEEVHNLADITSIKTSNIDSTDMGTEQREMIAKTIYDNERKFDGFVVTHGTDTMADTAAALNYMIQDLGKPVILTGAQKSIFEPVSDGVGNIYHAVKAATLDYAEIAIVFGEQMVRGPRATKISEHGFTAFSSPRVPPIGEISIDIIPHDGRIKRYNGDPRLFTKFATNIEFYHQSSGTSTTIFKSYVENEDIEGIVIGAFGAGNIQSRLIPHIKHATELGKPVLVITNCLLGAADMGLYEAGSAPLEAGAISAGDMTMEAAIQKLMYATGRVNEEEIPLEEKLEFIKRIIHRPYNLDITITETRFK